MAPHRKTGADVRAALQAIASGDEREKVATFYKGERKDNQVLGVPIGSIFPVAKGFTDLPLTDVEALLDDRCYEVRMAAVAIMDFKARAKSIDPAQRQALFELYMRRHDRIDNWDLVDRAAPHVVGEYLIDSDRSVLDRLAASSNPWERRTAIVATHAFIKKGEIEPTFSVAERLVDDAHPYVQMAIASWVREAGKRDEARLTEFLKTYAARLPRKTLRDAAKNLAPSTKDALIAAT